MGFRIKIIPWESWRDAPSARLGNSAAGSSSAIKRIQTRIRLSCIRCWAGRAGFYWGYGKEEEGKSSGVIRQYVRIFWRSDIMAAASTDPAFLPACKPETALVSAGRNNRYGHPSPEVVDSLLQQNIRIWRTDTDGVVVSCLLGKTGTFSPFLP